MSLQVTDPAEIVPGTVALIKPDSWFYGPDGKIYEAVYGPCYVIEAKDLLGLKPSQSANWYLQVGDGDNKFIFAGCQVHYAAIFPACPRTATVIDATQEG